MRLLPEGTTSMHCCYGASMFECGLQNDGSGGPLNECCPSIPSMQHSLHTHRCHFSSTVLRAWEIYFRESADYVCFITVLSNFLFVRRTVRGTRVKVNFAEGSTLSAAPAATTIMSSATSHEIPVMLSWNWSEAPDSQPVALVMESHLFQLAFEMPVRLPRHCEAEGLG